jgi:putative DNA primase/helicase
VSISDDSAAVNGTISTETNATTDPHDGVASANGRPAGEPADAAADSTGAGIDGQAAGQAPDPEPSKNGTADAPRPKTKKEIEESPERPTTLWVCSDGIPDELKKVDHWICWAYERQDGKWCKVPKNGREGRYGNADSMNPNTWATFEEVKGKYKGRNNYVGVGFVFYDPEDPAKIPQGVSADPFTGVDLDDCRNPLTGELTPEAQAWVSFLDSYTEISPSKTGLKIFLRGKIPAKPKPRCKNLELGIEIYSRGRYFAVTGHHLDGTPRTVNDRQQQLEEFYKNVFPPKAKKPKDEPKTETQRDGQRQSDAQGNRNGDWQPSDQDILDKARQAKNGDKFTRLWSGDTSGHNGDDSRTDLALCSMLAFWVGNDHNRIDALFRRSGLYREKWERADYRQKTIETALEGCTEFYDWNRHRGGRRGSHASPSADAHKAHLTDWGNAMRLVKRHGVDLHHCWPWKKWLVWTGQQWTDDVTGETTRRLKDTIAGLYKWALAKLAETDNPISPADVAGGEEGGEDE